MYYFDPYVSEVVEFGVGCRHSIETHPFSEASDNASPEFFDSLKNQLKKEKEKF